MMGQVSARSFWQVPPGTPEWMRPPDWMALGHPGKLVGSYWDPRTRQWIPAEAAAGLGNPGKIVGYDPVTGTWYYAAAGLGKIYTITMPVIGKQPIDIPIEEIVRDAIDEAQSEMWERIKRNWYYVAGAGLLIGAAVLMARKKS